MPLLTVWVTGLVPFASAGSETALSPASVMFPLTGVARVSQVGTARGTERKGQGFLESWIPRDGLGVPGYVALSQVLSSAALSKDEHLGLSSLTFWDHPQRQWRKLQVEARGTQTLE